MPWPAADASGLRIRMYQSHLPLIDSFSAASFYTHSPLQRVSPAYNLHYRPTFRSIHTETLQHRNSRRQNRRNLRGNPLHDRPRSRRHRPLLYPLPSVNDDYPCLMEKTLENTGMPDTRISIIGLNIELLLAVYAGGKARTKAFETWC